MDWTLFFTALGAITTVISTIIAIKAKNEAKKILVRIKEENSRNVKNKGNIKIKNEGNNTGVMMGINTGEIHDGKK